MRVRMLMRMPVVRNMVRRKLRSRWQHAFIVVDCRQQCYCKEEYATEGIKGRVQDRNLAIEVEPMFTLSYYVTTTEIKEVPYYIKEVDDLNATRALRFLLMTTNREPSAIG